jgi:glutamate-1-semialdehyde 2,1-aminomutase
MTTSMPTVDRLSERLDALITEQELRFLERQPVSRSLHLAACEHLAGGVTSSWQISEPQAVWVSHGAGSKIYDVDGTEYVDLHGGYGADLAGHAHPAIVDAVRHQIGRGSHFAQPTPEAIEVGDELAARFGLPLWRFANSGTEATMDAVHLMRAATSRDLIIKVEGCYHGHHDSVQVSVAPEAGEIGPDDRPTGVSSSSGIPRAITDLTLVVGFNDLAGLQRLLEEHAGRVAGMIVEPIMMNAGIILPDPGYLAGLVELLHRHGALLTFDEVKTGFTVGPGGATRAFGVQPDIICLAKSFGGGLATAAIGGSAEVMETIISDVYEQCGTFNGNPLAMSAAKAALLEVYTPDAYEHLDELRAQTVAGLEPLIADAGLSANVVAVGAKGCVTFLEERPRNYRDFLEIDGRYNHAHWLVQHNGGVFLPPWGKTEQWLLSVAHDRADIDKFLENFATFAAALTD